MRLDIAEHLETERTLDGQLVVEPSFVKYLRSQGYQVEGIEELHAVESESDEEKGYAVAKVKTYLFPSDDPLLDVAEHGISIWTCSCWDFRENSPDVSQPDVTPADTEPCKHVKKCDKSVKASQDEQQQTF